MSYSKNPCSFKKPYLPLLTLVRGCPHSRRDRNWVCVPDQIGFQVYLVSYLLHQGGLVPVWGIMVKSNFLPNPVNVKLTPSTAIDPYYEGS